MVVLYESLGAQRWKVPLLHEDVHGVDSSLILRGDSTRFPSVLRKSKVIIMVPAGQAVFSFPTVAF
jgi:hypothetical protein